VRRLLASNFQWRFFFIVILHVNVDFFCAFKKIIAQTVARVIFFLQLCKRIMCVPPQLICFAGGET
jgi:hypothetical protein